MADISSYLEAIDTAVKGEEVRGSIHDAIEAINNENITLHEQIVEDVEDIVTEVVTEAIDDSVLTFTYNPRVQSSGNIYLNTPMTYTDIFASPLIELRWVVTSGGVIVTHDGSYECIGKTLATTGSMGHLYFYNTYTESIIDVNIPTGTDPQYLFTYTEIPLPGGGGGSTYTAGTGIDITNYVISALDQSFTLSFTIDNNGNIHVSKSSTDAETFMNSKYGLNNWSWLDFWKEAKIILIDEYNDHHSSSNPNILMCTHLEASNSGDVDIYFTESIIDDYNIPGGISRTVHFTWIYNTSWDTEDSISHGNYYDYKKVITSGTGISISESTSIQYGTSDIEISLDLQNAEDNSF